MKKLIILIFMMLSLSSISQTIDTSNFAFVLDENGFYSELVNRTTYQGIPAGSFRVPISFEYNSIDTSLWNITKGKNGFYSYAVNRGVFYGKDTATVRLQLTYPTGNSTGTATTSSGIATLNATNGIITTDHLANIPADTYTEITLLNNFIKSNSIITFSTEDRNNSIPALSSLSIVYNSLIDGEVKFGYVCNQMIQFEINIHFTITNP